MMRGTSGGTGKHKDLSYDCRTMVKRGMDRKNGRRYCGHSY